MIAHLDCSTGVSGDKFLAALLDAGREAGSFSAGELQRVVAALAPGAVVEVSRTRTHGVSATTVQVSASAEQPHRRWTDIRELIERAELPAVVRERSCAVFLALAEAEGAVHGCAPEDVHFHEVGAIDSIADVVGVCSGLHALGITSLTASPLAVGWGEVACAHGVLPVPAPATARLLLGAATVPGQPRPDGSAPGELTTPTGAALVTVLADSYGPAPAMTPRLVGWGAGTRDVGRPNVCRLVAGDPPGEVPLSRQAVSVLETNVDHLSPEAVAAAVDQLLAEGVADVWTSPIVMKKGRSAAMLSVLTLAEQAESFAARIVALTGTLGVRRLDIERFVAEREVTTASTPYGDVRFKVGPIGARPEADDVARIAREQGRSFTDVADELARFLA